MGFMDSREEFTALTTHLNQHQSSIKIKYIIDPLQVNFLDVVAYKDPDFLETGKLDFSVLLKKLTPTVFYTKTAFTQIIPSRVSLNLNY